MWTSHINTIEISHIYKNVGFKLSKTWGGHVTIYISLKTMKCIHIFKKKNQFRIFNTTVSVTGDIHICIYYISSEPI